jgi:cell shape-determining protein MreC
LVFDKKVQGKKMEKQFKLFMIVIVLVVLGVAVFAFITNKNTSLLKKSVEADKLLYVQIADVEAINSKLSSQRSEIESIKSYLRKIEQEKAQAAQLKAEEESRKEAEKEANKQKLAEQEKERQKKAADAAANKPKSADRKATDAHKPPVAKPGVKAKTGTAAKPTATKKKTH